MYLCKDSAFFEGVEVEFVVSLAESWDINVVETMQAYRLVQLVRTKQLSDYTEPERGRQLRK